MQHCSSWQPAGGLLTQPLLLLAATPAALVLVTQHACDPHVLAMQTSFGHILLVFFQPPAAPTCIGMTAVA
jgi:hypothetical protein